MSVNKRAHELRIGDKILGERNHYIVQEIRYNGLAGTLFPVIHVIDAYGKPISIDTGSRPQLQDHIWECEK